MKYFNIVDREFKTILEYKISDLLLITQKKNFYKEKRYRILLYWFLREKKTNSKKKLLQINS